jgi:hypothetical protein
MMYQILDFMDEIRRRAFLSKAVSEQFSTKRVASVIASIGFNLALT